jgi:DNA-binding NtrC family response regulator
LRPDIRVLFMTGHAETDSASQAKLPPETESLQKPFSRDLLLRHVRQLLDGVPVQMRD